jgi:hypothetical protein
VWALKNLTPYAAERSWTRDKTGAHLWLVAVKATFDLGVDGRVTVADEQTPAGLAPEYFGDPSASSIRDEADVVPPKPTTDVVVEASAHAPKGRAVNRVEVTLRAGALQKAIVVHGPRVYYRGASGQLTTSAGVPFVTQPIRFEDAFGGSDLSDPDPRRQRMDLRNPVGRGVAIDPDRLVNQPAHTLEYPGGDAAKRGPAALGPIASFWSPRREHAGSYDDTWMKTRMPLLPDDFDERFHQCAPPDQRSARPMVGGEPVGLVNATPEGVLAFALPTVRLGFSTRFGARSEEHTSRLGTVIVKADRRKLMMVWQTALRVKASEVDYLDETVITELGRAT